MSPSPAKGDADQDKAFGPIKVPCLHMTGTKDDGVAITEAKPADRRVPFDHMSGKANHYLVIFKDGDHMVFANVRGKRREGRKDPRFHDLIRMSTTAFWDAYLKGEGQAKGWLGDKGFQQALADDGTIEMKKGRVRSSPKRLRAIAAYCLRDGCHDTRVQRFVQPCEVFYFWVDGCWKCH